MYSFPIWGFSNPHYYKQVLWIFLCTGLIFPFWVISWGSTPPKRYGTVPDFEGLYELWRARVATSRVRKVCRCWAEVPQCAGFRLQVHRPLLSALLSARLLVLMNCIQGSLASWLPRGLTSAGLQEEVGKWEGRRGTPSLAGHRLSVYVLPNQSSRQESSLGSGNPFFVSALRA